MNRMVQLPVLREFTFQAGKQTRISSAMQEIKHSKGRGNDQGGR